MRCIFVCENTITLRAAPVFFVSSFRTRRSFGFCLCQIMAGRLKSLLPLRTTCVTLIFYISICRARRLGTRQLFRVMIAERDLECPLCNHIFSDASIKLDPLFYSLAFFQIGICTKFQMQSRCTVFCLENFCCQSLAVIIHLLRQRIRHILCRLFSIRMADTPFCRGKRDIHGIILRCQYNSVDLRRADGIKYPLYIDIDLRIMQYICRFI